MDYTRRLHTKYIMQNAEYISVKLLHDSSGHPYIKDRLLSYATGTLERISKNPLVEESITFNRVNQGSVAGEVQRARFAEHCEMQLSF